MDEERNQKKSRSTYREIWILSILKIKGGRCRKATIYRMKAE
jgi:hypothetical protein